jgi:hypothetical protein
LRLDINKNFPLMFFTDHQLPAHISG